MTEDPPALPSYPARTARDTTRTLLDASVSALPIVGGPAQVLLTDYLPSSFGKRRDEWFSELGALVNDLSARHPDLDVEALAEDERFVSAVAAASRIALGTHLEAKLELLKRALQRIALEPERDDFMTSRLLRFVEELSPEHFVVLSYVTDPEAAIRSKHIVEPGLAFQGTKGGGAKGNLGLGADVLRLALRDLADQQLLDVKHPVDAPGEPFWGATLTPLGQELVNFVEAI